MEWLKERIRRVLDYFFPLPDDLFDVYDWDEYDDKA